MNELMIDSLETEYDAIIADLSSDATDQQIVEALVAQADWTIDGASAVVTLARTHGVFVLRNALALANAMGIEDGDAGF